MLLDPVYLYNLPCYLHWIMPTDVLVLTAIWQSPGGRDESKRIQQDVAYCAACSLVYAPFPLVAPLQTIIRHPLLRLFIHFSAIRALVGDAHSPLSVRE
jgi:hypothetical protein